MLWVEGACIVGALDLRHAQLKMPLIMRHCYFDGRVDLSEAHAVSVSLSGSRFPSFCGYGLQVDGDADWSGCRAGQIDIFGARIGVGRLWLSGAELNTTGSSYALNAPDLTVDGGTYCRGLRATGGINLYCASIGSTLELDGAVLSNQDGPALRAPGLNVKADMSCGRTSTQRAGSICSGLRSAASCGSTTPASTQATATGANAPQICVNGGLYCNGRFSASGMINLFGAVIGSTLEFDGATLSDPAWKCLRAPGLTVKNSVSFTEGFKASGEIDLARSHVGGELWLTETAFTDGMLDLGGAEIGQLHAEPESLPGRLRLNGLTYTSLQPYLPALQRLEILGRDIDGYQPQPYEQLAAYYRALGYDEQARTVLLAKQRRRREGLTAASKAWRYLQDAAIGYGYRPARALIWLIVLVGLTAAYFTAYPPHATKGSSHAQFQPIIYASYAVVPILNIGQPNPYPASATGQWIVWIAQLARWTLASTVVAGVAVVVSRN